MISNLKSRFKNIYEYITHIRPFAFGKLNIHNCTRYPHYWERDYSCGVYCAVCGRSVSEETYERPTTSWSYDGAEDHSS